jgi:hypothetical protein
VAAKKATIKKQAKTIKKRDREVIDLKNTLARECENLMTVEDEIVALKQKLEDQDAIPKRSEKRWNG